MKKLRCTSCGAELKIEDNNEYAVCEHCGSKYKLNEDLNVNIKLDDNTKEMINKGLGTAKHFSIVLLLPFILIIVIFIVGIIFSIKGMNEARNKQEESQDKFKEESNEQMNQFMENAAKDSFNFQFNSSAGTKSGFFLETTLDTIIKSNKTNNRKVSLVFNGNSTQDENEIIEIKHNLGNSNNYEVSVNYDDDGYVYEINVVKLN